MTNRRRTANKQGTIRKPSDRITQVEQSGTAIESEPDIRIILLDATLTLTSNDTGDLVLLCYKTLNLKDLGSTLS